MSHSINHPAYARWAHVLLRVVAGLFLAQHGAQKLFGLLGGVGSTPGVAAPLVSLFGLAGVIEFFGGLLVAIGLFTRPAAFVIAGEMAVAYFMVHAPNSIWPIVNRGELAALYSFVFLYYSATGAGAISLDYLRARRSPKKVMG